MIKMILTLNVTGALFWSTALSAESLQDTCKVKDVALGSYISRQEQDMTKYNSKSCIAHQIAKKIYTARIELLSQCPKLDKTGQYKQNQQDNLDLENDTIHDLCK